MAPDNYQIQHDLAMEQLERERNDSSIDEWRGAHHNYSDIFGRDPSMLDNDSLLPNNSKKRGLSPGENESFDKRQRHDSSVLPPMITSMDNIMDVISAPLSPTRKSGRKVHELNQLPPSPSRTTNAVRRRKGPGFSTKENQEDQDDDVDDPEQMTTAQEVCLIENHLH